MKGVLECNLWFIMVSVMFCKAQGKPRKLLVMVFPSLIWKWMMCVWCKPDQFFHCCSLMCLKRSQAKPIHSFISIHVCLREREREREGGRDRRESHEKRSVCRFHANSLFVSVGHLLSSSMSCSEWVTWRGFSLLFYMIQICHTNQFLHSLKPDVMKFSVRYTTISL